MTTSTSGGGGLRVSQLFVLGATDPSSKFNTHPILLVFFFFFQWQVGWTSKESWFLDSEVINPPLKNCFWDDATRVSTGVPDYFFKITFQESRCHRPCSCLHNLRRRPAGLFLPLLPTSKGCSVQRSGATRSGSFPNTNDCVRKGHRCLVPDSETHTFITTLLSFLIFIIIFTYITQHSHCKATVFF